MNIVKTMNSEVIELTTYIVGANGHEILLPVNISLQVAQYERRKDDLVVTHDDHICIYVRGYFRATTFADLNTMDGDQLSGEMVNTMAGLSGRMMGALSRMGSLI